MDGGRGPPKPSDHFQAGLRRGSMQESIQESLLDA